MRDLLDKLVIILLILGIINGLGLALIVWVFLFACILSQ